ncbi:hypothetical protein DFH06DRAFT_1327474 [Mycena polygramma]|nr:hypothetical protein DFH06DRAFT_1327474 [Mycena polygramma]
MHAFTSLPLDDDLIDRILGFCPEFDTLLALLSTCKTIYSIFNTRPRSIIRTVAYNVAGPALADAVLALRPRKTRSTEECRCSLEELLEMLALSPAEKYKLQKNANVVRRFENVFSSWYKDQMSPKCTLLHEESFRFHRGLYRIILYSETFSPDYYYLKDLERSDYERLEKVQTERKQLLTRYSTEELLEMHAVVCFVTQMLEDVFGPNNIDRVQWGLSAGPAQTIEAFETDCWDPIQECFEIDLQLVDDDFAEYDGYFTDAFSRMWKERCVTPPPDGPYLGRSILDEINPEIITATDRRRQSKWPVWTAPPPAPPPFVYPPLEFMYPPPPPLCIADHPPGRHSITGGSFPGIEVTELTEESAAPPIGGPLLLPTFPPALDILSDRNRQHNYQPTYI